MSYIKFSVSPCLIHSFFWYQCYFDDIDNIMKRIQNSRMRVLCFVLLNFLGSSSILIAQLKQTQFNGFGHSEYSIIHKDSTDSYFSLGEHDFFVTSNISKRVSFLGEYILRFNSKSAGGFMASIERSFIKFNYANNRSIIAGKIHTPLNYWNDVYHHGRVFFPVIDRPLAFTYIIPLHTLGFQLQGQNIGKLGFGYDAVVGNGIASSDVFQSGLNPSLTLAMHLKPRSGMRLGLSYYYNYLKQNFSGAHVGHATAPIIDNNIYNGPVDFQLFCGSFAWFGKRFELLNELSFNQSRTDSLGLSNNYSGFIYAGLRLNDKNIPFLLFDYLRIGNNDLHVFPAELMKLGLGYRYEFNYLLNLKVQLEHTMNLREKGHMSHSGAGMLGFRMQLAYGF